MFPHRRLWLIEGGKVGDRKYLIFPHLCLVRSKKVERWKTLLFGEEEKWEDKKCILYKFTLIFLLHKKIYIKRRRRRRRRWRRRQMDNKISSKPLSLPHLLPNSGRKRNGKPKEKTPELHNFLSPKILPIFLSPFSISTNKLNQTHN